MFEKDEQKNDKTAVPMDIDSSFSVTPSLVDLPEEVLTAILLFMDPDSLLKSIKPLNRQFSRLANDELIWKKLCETFFPEINITANWQLAFKVHYVKQFGYPQAEVRNAIYLITIGATHTLSTYLITIGDLHNLTLHFIAKISQTPRRQRSLDLFYAKILPSCNLEDRLRLAVLCNHPDDVDVLLQGIKKTASQRKFKRILNTSSWYDFVLLSNQIIEKDKIYIRFINGLIIYSVIDPQGKIQHGEVRPEHIVLRQRAKIPNNTLKWLELPSHKKPFLKILSARGHISFSESLTQLAARLGYLEVLCKLLNYPENNIHVKNYGNLYDSLLRSNQLRMITGFHEFVDGHKATEDNNEFSKDIVDRATRFGLYGSYDFYNNLIRETGSFGALNILTAAIDLRNKHIEEKPTDKPRDITETSFIRAIKTALFSAAKMGHINIIEFALDRNLITIHKKLSDNSSRLLDVAGHYKQIELIQFLLSRGAGKTTHLQRLIQELEWDPEMQGIIGILQGELARKKPTILKEGKKRKAEDPGEDQSVLKRTRYEDNTVQQEQPTNSLGRNMYSLFDYTTQVPLQPGEQTFVSDINLLPKKDPETDAITAFSLGELDEFVNYMNTSTN